MGVFSSRLSSKEMAIICRQLATAYGAGIPILQALRLTAQQGTSPRGRGALLRMEAQIGRGASLADACRSERHVFPDLFVQAMAGGETGGRLDVLLRDLAGHYEETHRMKRAVVSSMIYPVMQLVCAWFLGTFALGILKGIGNFQSSAGRFSMQDYLAHYVRFQIAALLLFAAVTALFIGIGRSGWLNGPASLIKNSLWPLNGVLQKFAMARFYRGMAASQSGLDIKRCIERSAAMTMNPAMERDLLRALPVVSRGGTLVEAFSTSRYMSRMGKEMLSVGEQSGDLDTALQKAAEYSLGEAQAAVKSAAKVLQVVITLIVGGVVAYFVISFYSSLYGSALNGL